MERRCDVLIVGARCAGATLGVLLARRGLSTVILDKDRLPSDQVISTHTIHPPGMDVLDEVGVGAEVRRLSPASRVVRLAKNHAAVDLELADGRAEYCPRRERLDALLQQAAADAGAEVIDRCRVTSLVEKDGRTAGVRASRDGIDCEFHASIVVGADGRHSTVAKLVGAEEYLAYDAPRGAYWGYWDMPGVWRDKERYPFDMYVGNRAGEVRLIFQTDADQLLIASAPPLDEAKRWRSDPLGALTLDLASDPLIAPLIEERTPREPVRGTINERYFFRRGAGPGWALAGDAGHHKDYLIGDGITEAVLQARSLAPAIVAGTDAALERWWRERDVHALPMFYFATDEGRPEPPATLQTIVFEHVAKDETLRRRMVRMMEHELSPYEVFAVPQIFRWTLAAALKGRPRVLGEFLAMGKRATAFQKELAHRRRLVAETASATI